MQADFSCGRGTRPWKYDKEKLYGVAIIGVGPAGLSALVYLLEPHLNVIAVGPEVGGQ